MLAIKVHLKETFGNNASTAACRGAAIVIALFAVINFLVNIYKSPYDSFEYAIGLLLVAYALAGSKSPEY
jgi:hypothetical protein